MATRWEEAAWLYPGSLAPNNPDSLARGRAADYGAPPPVPPPSGLLGAGPATADCARAPRPGAGRACGAAGQRHGRRPVWLLVPRGRGRLSGGRPGPLHQPGECPRDGGRQGARGGPLAPPLPGAPGRVPREGGAGAGAASARAFVCVCSRGSGVRVSWGVCQWLCLPVLEGASLSARLLSGCVLCIFQRVILRVCTSCVSVCVCPSVWLCMCSLRALCMTVFLTFEELRVVLKPCVSVCPSVCLPGA